MQDDRFSAFRRAVEDASHDIVRACRRVGRAIAVLPWPAVLACCVLLAIVISVLPLALFLFILFMLVKIVIGAFVIDCRRTPYHESKE